MELLRRNFHPPRIRFSLRAGFWPGLILLILPVLMAGCEPSPQPVEDERGPDDLIQSWVEMWNSYDLDQVELLFLDDPRLTYFSSEKQGVIRGMEALLEHHRGFGFVPGGDDRASRLWLEGLETDLLGAAAVVTGLWLFQSDTASGEDPQRGPVTFVCVHEDEGWRFVHMNFSEYIPPEGA